ncbi:MAG: hypothetical protein ACJAXR_002640 [Halopseudomonas sp.]|jgi:hypothetical protein
MPEAQERVLLLGIVDAVETDLFSSVFRQTKCHFT